MLTSLIPPPAFTSPPILLFYLSLPPCLSSPPPSSVLVYFHNYPSSFVFYPSLLSTPLSFTLNTTSGIFKKGRVYFFLQFPHRIFSLPPCLSVCSPLLLFSLPRGHVGKVGQGLALGQQQHPVIKAEFTRDKSFHGNWTLKGKTSH